jgi:hypothetical protein
MKKPGLVGEKHDCKATLDDQQVMDFCRNGYLKLEGVVPDKINTRVVDFLDTHDSAEPSEILAEDWFVDGVIKNPQAAGAVRSLLGKNFALPLLISNHRVHCPAPTINWHQDGGSIITARLDYLQVFYYPESVSREMGPTEILPGSHLQRGYGGFLSRLRSLKGSVLTVSAAGTIFLTAYSIWHRRSASTGTGIRNHLKYNYWRTVPPCRDWNTDPAFNFSWLDNKVPPFTVRAAELLAWLCAEEWQHLGGQSWPCFSHTVLDSDQPGLPQGLRRDGQT